MKGNTRFLKFVFMAVAFVLLAAYAVMLLWNALMPYIFTLKPITYFQALGLMLLSKLLFGCWRSGRKSNCSHSLNNLNAKQIDAMNPEEREKFKAQFYNKCKEKWGCDWPDANA